MRRFRIWPRKSKTRERGAINAGSGKKRTNCSKKWLSLPKQCSKFAKWNFKNTKISDIYVFTISFSESFFLWPFHKILHVFLWVVPCSLKIYHIVNYPTKRKTIHNSILHVKIWPYDFSCYLVVFKCLLVQAKISFILALNRVSWWFFH